MSDMADWQLDQMFMEDDGPEPCPECEGCGIILGKKCLDCNGTGVLGEGGDDPDV
jgi:DnaJ-class molecular chaperone